MISDIYRNALTSVREWGWRRTLVAYAHLARWNFASHIVGADVLIRRIHGYKMYLSLREPGISLGLNMFGSREAEHVYVVERVLQPGQCALDIGGNIGFYALMEATHVGPGGKVYAVEPVPSNCSLLRRNVALNRFEAIIDVEQLAISDRVGTRPLHLSRLSNLHSFHGVVDPDLKRFLDLSGETLAVDTVDLETFLRHRRRPDFIRMDIEGHEVEILRDLAAWAGREHWYPGVLLEVHAGQYDDETRDIRAPLRALFALGYRVQYAASQMEPAPWFAGHGYRPVAVVADDGPKPRGIYMDLPNEDALAVIPALDQVRCIYLSRRALPRSLPGCAAAIGA